MCYKATIRDQRLRHLILSISIAFFAFNKYKNDYLKVIIPWALILVVILSFEGYYRVKLLLAGPPIDKNDYSTQLNNNFFRNQKTSSFHQKYEVSVENFFIKNLEHLEDKKILFLSRIEYLYAKHNISSPPGLPLWWHLGSSYLSKSINKINKTIIDDVDYVIALSAQGNPDAGLMASDKIYNTITGGEFFTKDLSYPGIVIFTNKKLIDK